MPQNKFSLARYYIIDNLLQKSKYVKTSLMAERCEEITGYRISQRTIQMDIETMKNDSFLGYYAPINYCNNRKAYYYSTYYKLSPFQFNKEDVNLLEELFLLNRDQLEKERCKLFEAIIQKIKIFVVDF